MIQLFGPEFSWLAVVMVAPLIWVFGEIVPTTISRLFASKTAPACTELRVDIDVANGVPSGLPLGGGLVCEYATLSRGNWSLPSALFSETLNPRSEEGT